MSEALSTEQPGVIKYPHLFKPVTIRGNVYKNRMIAAPTMFMHASYFIPKMRENIYRMVEQRAAGGFGCVSTGEMPLNFEEARTLFQKRKIDFTKYSGPDFEIAKEYADRIHAKGAIAYMEFSHEGSQAAEAKEPWGPEDMTRDDGVKVKGMDEEMMAKVCNDFYQISRFAKKCGFDGVMLHGGHGFLLQQYISPWTNHRTDEYGGSMENRARFPKRILEACRHGIGEDGILELRFSAEDGVHGGMKINDTVAFCQEIDGMADILHISNGLKWLGNQTKTFSSFLDPHGLNVEYAAKVKAAVKKSYVATIGGFNGPELAEKVIAEGKADFIEFGRQCFADPAMPNKALQGKEDEIRRCIRCFVCYPGFCEHPTDIPLAQKIGPEKAAKIYSPMSMGQCTVNPESGFDFNPDAFPKPKSVHKVLIIGGGVGGLQAAITARQRGHKVVLVEQQDRLGGTVNFTDVDEDKIDLCNAKNVIIKQAQESGAEIRLNTKANADLIAKEAPDDVIIAVGAHSVVPKIDGIEKATQAIDAYAKIDQIERNVVIVGGGLVGCEVGLHLARHGKAVTIVEMKDMMADETFGYYRNALLNEMDHRGMKQILSAKCLAFTDDGVLIEKDGQKQLVKADSMCFSMGMHSNEDEVTELKAASGEADAWVIGDAKHAGKVYDAVKGGYMTAMKII
ncbi:oxidoreductase [Secundilactobacillus paracollinoides]|uniref:NADH-flavin oxidoreductase, Old yellow enzyme family protein n=1 Tax=Secundilactobacillus paracollinoides TaxID=240427 RepID=A0A1B2IYB9_9LACO|nr:FAD-dependent oxidoreductase [Secundilactobacillus paracollinoides]ANZ61110.1 NADH-flavin oxidoreductase, Old yellow enzyme family protein [Secundilactobacillus paracollinoides]ANZ67031.1 NADH-flavin oxidoreductase, Old yellow enzyme family protein [Secundilactobacillus paracollinoides]